MPTTLGSSTFAPNGTAGVVLANGSMSSNQSGEGDIRKAMVDRTRRELTDDDIQLIAKTYHAWRGQAEAGPYEDVPGFVSPLRWTISASMAMCLHPVAMSALPNWKMIANLLRKNGAAVRPVA